MPLGAGKGERRSRAGRGLACETIGYAAGKTGAPQQGTAGAQCGEHGRDPSTGVSVRRVVLGFGLAGALTGGPPLYGVMRRRQTACYSEKVKAAAPVGSAWVADR